MAQIPQLVTSEDAEARKTGALVSVGNIIYDTSLRVDVGAELTYGKLVKSMKDYGVELPQEINREESYGFTQQLDDARRNAIKIWIRIRSCERFK